MAASRGGRSLEIALKLQGANKGRRLVELAVVGTVRQKGWDTGLTVAGEKVVGGTDWYTGNWVVRRVYRQRRRLESD